MLRFDLSNKVAIVTGGGSGIGEKCALPLAGSGASVAVVDYDQKNGECVADAITGNKGNALFVKADVSLPDQVQAMVKQTVDAFGKLDIAVNNAGVRGESNQTGDYSPEGWLKVISINLNGVFYRMRYEIPQMLKNGGAIVNMASILGLVGFANSPAYVAAKHGVVGLTQTAAIEYTARGIRVNSVGPGFIVTPLLTNSLDEPTTKAIAAMHPIGRLGNPKRSPTLSPSSARRRLPSLAAAIIRSTADILHNKRTMALMGPPAFIERVTLAPLPGDAFVV